MNRTRKILEAIAQSKFGRRSTIAGIYGLLLIIFLHIPVIKDYLLPPQSLCVYGFTDMFHQETIIEFERLHKVKVILRYFESNEELWAKFRINRGIGYDVIMTSDYMVELLRRDNMLCALDHRQLPSMQELDPRLLNKSYDPHNTHSLPYSWIPYGIIFHKKIFTSSPETIGLHLLFSNPQDKLHGVIKPYRICMTDDSREAILLASLYLFGNVTSWTPEQLAQIEALLIQQKKWVESYVNQDLAYPLLSGLIKVAMAPLFAVDKVLKASNDFAFLLPAEGSMYSIENLAIPRPCKHVALAQAFINFVLSKNEAARMSNLYGMNPSNRAAYAMLHPEKLNNKHAFPDDEHFAKLHLLSNDVPLKKFEKIWLAVKSS